MVTDCGSFLTEYAVMSKPIIYLKSLNGKKHNSMVEKLLNTYYIVKDESDLYATLNNLINKGDVKKIKRENVVKYLNLRQSNASNNIVEDLESILS